jgi:hypothetical protein
MSVEILSTTGGILAARLTGKLTRAELAVWQNAVVGLIQEQGKVRLLVIAENFEGWEKGGDWGDISFQMDHDPHIEKMAIVGEQKWAELALIFTGKGLRDFPIEYFPPTDLAKAQAWLATDN